MKPIKTRLTPDQIIALETLLEQLPNWTPNDQIARLTKSIIVDVADKVHSRYRKVIKSHDLFDAKKTIGLELKFHEAFAVTIFIEIMLPKIPPTLKKHNDLFMLHNYLHQKLA
jgi:hypothetical protein